MSKKIVITLFVIISLGYLISLILPKDNGLYYKYFTDKARNNIAELIKNGDLKTVEKLVDIYRVENDDMFLATIKLKLAEKELFEVRMSNPHYKRERIYAEDRVTELAKRKYYNDKTMINYMYKEQMEAFDYMFDTKDSECRAFAKRKYPDDWAMQKYVYNEQLEAKEYMNRVPYDFLKRKAQEKYPGDYSMQKYIYTHD